MANFDFEQLKGKVKDTLGVVADTTKEIAGKTAEKAKCAARIAKLSMEISGEKDTIKKAYLEIGKLYYEMHRDDPDGFFAQLCDEVTVANASIRSKEQEIADLKAGINAGDDIEVEFVECDEAEPCYQETDCCCETEPEEVCCCETATCCCEEEPKAEPCCEETTFCPECGEKDE